MENSLLKYPLSNWDTLPANPVLPPDWAGNETHESPASRGAEIYRIPTVSGKEVKKPGACFLRQAPGFNDWDSDF